MISEMDHRDGMGDDNQTTAVISTSPTLHSKLLASGDGVPSPSFQQGLSDQEGVDMMEYLRDVTDSLSPDVDSHQYECSAIQSTLDSLACGADVYRWCQKELKLWPSCGYSATFFVESVIKLVGAIVEEAQKAARWSALPARSGAPESDPLSVVSTIGLNLFELVNSLEMMSMVKNLDSGEVSSLHEDNSRYLRSLSMVSLDLDSDDLCPKKESEDVDQWVAVDDHIDPSLAEEVEAEWRMNVAEYLCYCLDGGVEPSFSLADVVTAVKLPRSPRNLRERLESVVDYLIYLCEDDGLYVKGPLIDRVKSLVGTQWTANESALCRLLQLGYVEYALGKSQRDDLYLSFLRDLILRDSSTDLQVAVCTEVARLGRGLAKTRMVDRGFVIELANKLRKSAEVVAVFILKALVNLTAGDKKAKNDFIESGAARILISRLSDTSDAMAKTTLMLLKNCTKSQEHRQQLVAEGVVTKVLQLLKSRVELNIITEDVLVSAAALVWNLSVDQTTQQKFVQEGIVMLLLHLLELSNTSLLLLEKLSGCMMILTTNNDDTKAQVGLMGGIATLHRLVNHGLDSPSRVLSRNVCEALVNLTTMQHNVRALMAVEENDPRIFATGATSPDKALNKATSHLLRRIERCRRVDEDIRENQKG